MFEQILERLDRMEELIRRSMSRPQEKDFYTVEEFAKLVNRAPYTIREYCRYGRIKAGKRACGRGNAKEWMISAEELERFQNEGLLPEHPRVA